MRKLRLKVAKGFVQGHTSTWKAASTALIISEQLLGSKLLHNRRWAEEKLGEKVLKGKCAKVTEILFDYIKYLTTWKFGCIKDTMHISVPCQK